MKINPSVNDSLKERAAHGSQEFPLQVYQDMEYCENGLILYNHWHEEAEILFVTEGMMELAVDGISILAGKDTIVLIPPNLLHVAYQYQNQKCRFSSIVFHPDFVSSKNRDIIQVLRHIRHGFKIRNRKGSSQGTDSKLSRLQSLPGTFDQGLSLPDFISSADKGRKTQHQIYVRLHKRRAEKENFKIH